MRIKDLYTVALLHYSGMEATPEYHQGASWFTYTDPKAQKMNDMLEEGLVNVNLRDYLNSVKIIKNKLRR